MAAYNRKPQPTPGSSELSQKRYAGLLDDALSEWTAMKTHMLAATHSDGIPPFTAPASPEKEYENLQAMKDRNDPMFWGSKAAQQRYAALAHRYGFPPAGGPAGAGPGGPGGLLGPTLPPPPAGPDVTGLTGSTIAGG